MRRVKLQLHKKLHAPTRHAKNALLAHPVKSVNHVRHAKSVSHAPPLPQKLRQPTKKHCPTMSNCWMKSRMAPKASVHVVAHAASGAAATVASVKAMPTAM